MQLNKLKETDWDMLVSWWDAWPNWQAPPKRILPDNGTGGFVVEHEGEFIVAGFLYFTNSESCLIEWIISNPNYKHRENRKTAIKHLITSIEEVAKSHAKKAARKAEGKAAEAQAKVDQLVKGRSTIINPYRGVTSLAGMASDASVLLNNPFENLGVATQAAEMQAEEADISLANTLDTLRATGASAGGATALAQAALKSKTGIAAGIESQEASNQKAKAQGEANLNQARMAEAQRLQSIAISEGKREQAAQAQGELFMFETEEGRRNADLDRASGLESRYSQQQFDAQAARASAIAGIGQTIAGVAGQVGSAAVAK